MTPTIPLGRVGGVPVRVGLSWLVVAPLVGVTLFAGIDPQQGDLATRVLVTAGGTVALFWSVLMHELGHALVARRMGVEVRRVVMFFLGGYTEMAVDASHPGREAAVSLAGPAVSGSLGVGFWGLGAVLPEVAGSTRILMLLAVVNGAVAVFNLLPGFPLDGGRITRSLLAIGGMPPRRAEAVTAWLGIVVGGGLVAIGTAGQLLGRPRTLLAIPVGGVLVILAWAARPVDRRVAADVMRPAPDPVSEVMALASLPDRADPVPVVSSGRLVGLVIGRRAAGLVAEAMDPVLPGDVVTATTPLVEVAERISRHRRTLVVIGETGAIVGIIRPEDLPDDLLSPAHENLME